ncbi:MAG: GntR family transcriptional regulator [Rhizobiaceae bacterium]
MEPDRQHSTSADVYEDMRLGLVIGRFDAGEKLRSEALREQYDCSASTIREVLFRLSSDGLVNFIDQKGFRVPRITLDDLREIAEMRIMLECEGAARSIEHGDIHWEAGLTAAHHKLRHIEHKLRTTGQMGSNVTVWCAAEWEFHRSLISACGSDYLLELHRNVYDRFRLGLLTLMKGYAFREKGIEEHEAILLAALDRDPVLCAEKIREHLMKNLEEPFVSQYVKS